MKIVLTCLSVKLVNYGPPMLEVELSGGPPSRSGTLKLSVGHPTDEQRHTFTPGEEYEVHVPSFPEQESP